MTRWESRDETLTAAMAQWVARLASWRVIAHHTWSWESSIFAAQKAYEKFMVRELHDVTYFYAIEANPSRCGHHVHALWADCEGVQRSEVWKRWHALYGRNRIEPVRGFMDVVEYCSKYVCKEGAWWNVKLVSPTLFHRAQDLCSCFTRQRANEVRSAVPPEPGSCEGMAANALAPNSPI